MKREQKRLNIENEISDFNVFADNKTMAVFKVKMHNENGGSDVCVYVCICIQQ